MTRDFADAAVAPELIGELVDLATRAPSAGKTQGWHLVVLEGPETSRFWDVTLPTERRPGFRWQGLLAAPVIALAFADPDAYVERYGEPDKARSGLGESADAWPTPYWTVDASMSVMTLLLAAEDAGLGALFFGVFNAEAELRASLGIPTALQLIGAIALGWPAATAADVPVPGLSASRRRRSAAEVIHRGGW
ncbi:MAG: putative oxidoreductase [Ilumatobacteraceae bacterium]|nr:putative oxidoreductase [Ilumatobacteraceae bacterium]